MTSTHVLEVEARLSAAFEEAQRRASQQEASRTALILQLQKRRQVDEANAEALANAAGRERLAEALTAADGVALRCRIEQKLLRHELCAPRPEVETPQASSTSSQEQHEI